MGKIGPECFHGEHPTLALTESQFLPAGFRYTKQGSIPAHIEKDGVLSTPPSPHPGLVAPPPGLDGCGKENVCGLVPNRVERPLSKEYRHKQVPKTVNLDLEYKNSSHGGPPTTLMIRNIPNRYTQHELIQELEDLGFAGTFDFFYMPVDLGRHRHHGVRKSTSNVGYAFVNFVEAVDAEVCREVMEKYVFKLYGNKVAIISVAHIQGLDANFAHYEKAAVNAVKNPNGPLVMANLSSTLDSRRSSISEVDLEDWAAAEAGLWAPDWTWTWSSPAELWPAMGYPWLSPSSICEPFEGFTSPAYIWPSATGTWGQAIVPEAFAAANGTRSNHASTGQGKKASAVGKRAGKRVAQIGGA